MASGVGGGGGAGERERAVGVDVEESGKRLEHGAGWRGGLNLAGSLVKCV